MGRKREIGTPIGDEKQSAILDAAAAVFMKQGFAATSLDDISDNYGASKGIIYYHFRNKTKLFFAVQRRAMELTREAISGIATGPGTPRERLKAMAVAHTLLMMEHLDYLRVAAQGLEMHLSGRTTEEERQEISSITALRDGNERLYLDVIEQGVRSGEFRNVNARVAVKPLLGALNWTSRWYHPRDGETRADRILLAEEIANFAVHALLPERVLKSVK
ncbi:TetR family transcriptional regulator [Bordetella petrii]|uniref:TetR family transcriptional regulator n=1 Tax=Bordetella petrii TaxID=94624 RepID=UPI003733D0B7